MNRMFGHLLCSSMAAALVAGGGASQPPNCQGVAPLSSDV